MERTKFDFRCPIYRSVIGQASRLICARGRQLDVLVLLLYQPNIHAARGYGALAEN